jgi:hypothetical protein
MKRSLLLSAPIATVILLSLLAAMMQTQPQVKSRRDEIPEAKKQQVIDNYGKIPLSFEANQGQTASEVQFLSRGSGYNLFLTPAEAVLVLSKSKSQSSDLLRMKMVGANSSARVAGLGEMAAKNNYFIGNDPSKWRTNISNYEKVKYEAVYPGVDMVYYGNQRQLEYDFVVASGADPSPIKLSFEGAESIEIDGEGNLVLSTRGGQIRQHRPIIYQEAENGREEIAGGYVLKGKSEAGFEVGFEVGAYDAGRPLVIDPVLSYSSYLGGIGLETSTDVVVDSAGNAYLTGNTQSSDFPTLKALQSNNGGGQDAFVTKLNSTGGVVYSSFLGGSGQETANSIALDPNGNVYVIGETNSSNFPTLNAYQSSLKAGKDAYVAKLNPSGNGLLYSSFLGGSGDETGFGLDVDSTGNAYLSGSTSSADFPILNGYQITYGGGTDGFVTKLNTNISGPSSLLYSTYQGSSALEQTLAIVLDSTGNAYVTGNTLSSNFFTKNAFQSIYGGNQDGFVAKLNTDLLGSDSLLYSSYVGGNTTEQTADIAVDSTGNAYLTGVTRSANYPTKNPLQSTIGGTQDALLMIVNTNLSGPDSLIYSSYLGGNGLDQGLGIDLDSDGNIYVAGGTLSANFPILDAYQSTIAGGEDVFVTKFNPSGNGLVYSTFLGGSGNDLSRGIAVDSKGNAYVIGHTLSNNFPTLNAFQSNYGEAQDAFVTKIQENAEQPPVAENDSYSTNEDMQLDVAAPGVLANDTDANGDTLSAILVSNTTSGMLTLNSDGSFSYIPDENFNGSDSFIYKASDGLGESNVATVTIIVNPVDDAPTVEAGGPYIVSEGGSVSVTASGDDVDGDTLTYAWDLDNNGSFETPGKTVTFSAANLNGPGSQTIRVRVMAGNLSAIDDATVEILNVAPSITALTLNALSISEGSSVTLTGTFTDAGNTDTHTVVINWGDGSSSTLPLLAAGVFTFSATHQYSDDDPTGTASDIYPITVSVSDDVETDTETTTVTVNNVAPTIVSITGPAAPLSLASATATLNVNFSDPGQDSHSFRVIWDDGKETVGEVAAGARAFTASNLYTAAGVYTVTVELTDDDTGVATSKYEFVVVYDPEGGFVTGGGFINSPAGALASNPSLTGKANFGFVSKYQKGATEPSGNTEFQFSAGNFNFKSTAYEFLVIAGSKAQFKGQGKVNGSGDYIFILTATDGQQPGGGGVDKFRIKITDRATGQLIYDNATDSSDDIDSANPQAIGGGSIVIHKQ